MFVWGFFSANSRFIPISRGSGRTYVIARNKKLPKLFMSKVRVEVKEQHEPFANGDGGLCSIKETLISKAELSIKEKDLLCWTKESLR